MCDVSSLFVQIIVYYRLGEREDMNKQYDTVIFDLDGTLLDTLGDLTDAVNYVMEQYGYPIHTLEAVRGFVGNGIRNLMIKATPQGEDHPKFEEGFTLFKEYYTAHSRVKTGPYDGIMPLLRQLHEKQIKLAIVSNKNQQAVEELAEFYFEGMITIAVGDDEIRQRKPAPDAVDEALRQLESDKEHTLYVGDSDVDAATAKNSGLDHILVSWGFRPKELLLTLGANGVIDEPQELLEYLGIQS